MKRRTKVTCEYCGKKFWKRGLKIHQNYCAPQEDIRIEELLNEYKSLWNRIRVVSEEIKNELRLK